jgi:hypothetical protein
MRSDMKENSYVFCFFDFARPPYVTPLRFFGWSPAVTLGDARLEVVSEEVALGDEEGSVGSKTAASFGVAEVAKRLEG